MRLIELKEALNSYLIIFTSVRDTITWRVFGYLAYFNVSKITF